MSLPSVSHLEAMDSEDEVECGEPSKVPGPSKAMLRIVPTQRVAPGQVAPMLPVSALAIRLSLRGI